MTFTFTLPFNDVSRVRAHTGQATEGETFLSDELIEAFITEHGSWQLAVIASFKYIILQLSQPDFRADWLQVTNAEARKGYETMLKEKKSELGVGGIVAGVVHVYRADSAQTEEPDYTDGRP